MNLGSLGTSNPLGQFLQPEPGPGSGSGSLQDRMNGLAPGDAPGSPVRAGMPGSGQDWQGHQVGDIGTMPSYGQIQGLYEDPNQAANSAAIQQGYGQGLQGYGPGGSSLAGVTHLGATANANAANINTGMSNNLLGQQQADINRLRDIANGVGPSLAQEQAKQQSDANIAAQMGMMGSQRGASNSSLGLRQAQNAAAQANQQGVQAGVLGRMQEEMAAQQQLTGALSGTQSQVMQGAQAQAALNQQANLQNAGAANASTLQQGAMDQQTALANLQAQLQAGQININQYNAMLQAQLAQSNNQWTANQNFGGLVTGENTQIQGINAGVGINQSNNSMGLTGAGIAGAAGLGAGALSAASDEALKFNVRDAARSIKAFLSQLGDSPGRGFRLMEVG